MPCGCWTKKVWTKTKTGPKSSEGYKVKLKQPLLSKPTLMTIVEWQLLFFQLPKKKKKSCNQPSGTMSSSRRLGHLPPTYANPRLPYPHPRSHFSFHSDLEVTFPCHSLTPVLSKCQPLRYGSFLHLLFFSKGRPQTPVHTYAPKWPREIAIALVPAVVEVCSWTCTRENVK